LVYTTVALLDEFLNEELNYGANVSGLLERKKNCRKLVQEFRRRKAKISKVCNLVSEKLQSLGSKAVDLSLVHR